jgi:Asp-tRNA(Asn)/Glu-tRNA(Gln) amidotransferase A subunit family amidase
MVTATEAVRLLSDREVSSEELVQRCLDGVQAHDDDVGAWAWLDAEVALTAARERARGVEERPRLDVVVTRLDRRQARLHALLGGQCGEH